MKRNRIRSTYLVPLGKRRTYLRLMDETEELAHFDVSKSTGFHKLLEKTGYEKTLNLYVVHNKVNGFYYLFDERKS